MKTYVYYQPNKKDVKDQYGDCTIRALSKVLDCTWLEAFDKTIPLCRKYQCTNVFDTPIKTRREILKQLGFDYYGISVRDGSKRSTVSEFAKEHPTGRYLANVSHHVVAIVNGQYYDTWDSGHKSLYGYFIKAK